jgi:hypothetical protein
MGYRSLVTTKSFRNSNIPVWNLHNPSVIKTMIVFYFLVALGNINFQFCERVIIFGGDEDR